MKITLSFDNGPYPEVTPRVLDTLASHDIKSTFFVLGSRIEADGGQACIQRAFSEGHQVGNHTYSHSFQFGNHPDQQKVLWELERTQELLGDLGVPKLFRPFGNGGLDKRLLSRTAFDYLKENGFSCVLWNSIPGDWENPQGWPDVALQQARDIDWSVVVVHDIPTGAMDSLDRFIKLAREEGATFTSEFPASVLPLINGAVKWDLSEYISDL